MSCPRCGAQVPEGQRFCGGCGAPMAAAPSDPPSPPLPPQALRCPRCSAPARAGTTFCGTCGAAIPATPGVVLAAAGSASAGSAPRASQANTTRMLALGALVGFALAAAATVLPWESHRGFSHHGWDVGASFQIATWLGTADKAGHFEWGELGPYLEQMIDAVLIALLLGAAVLAIVVKIRTARMPLHAFLPAAVGAVVAVIGVLEFRFVKEYFNDPFFRALYVLGGVGVGSGLYLLVTGSVVGTICAYFLGRREGQGH